MIILSEITDKLQVVLASSVTTNQLQCFASWRDRTSTTFIAGRTIINTNNITDVDLVGSPISATQRVVDFFTIFNRDTVNATVTIKLDANGVEYILFKATLATGEILVFQEGVGFYVLANSGAIKHSINQGNNTIGSSLTAVVLGADVINNNAVANTIQNVTGLSFEVTAENTYWFKFIIQHTAAATTTGKRWSISGPVAPTMLSYQSEYTLTATTSTRNAMLQAYDLPAASNATSVVAMNMAIIEGIIKPSANGTVIARFASEIAGSAITAKAGSVCYYQQTL
jgi:hypothetical protein